MRRFEVPAGGHFEAFDFALDPTPRQRRLLASHAGARRFAFNWGLDLVKDRLQARERVRRAALVEQLDDREVERLAGLVALPWTLPALRKEWNAVKDRVAPWWPECSKEAFSAGLADLAAALGAFSDSRAGRRRGAHVGFPRFQAKARDRPRFRYSTGSFGLAGLTALKLPRIGEVRTHEHTDRLGELLQTGQARVLSMTVTFRRDRWHAVLCCLVRQPQTVPAPAGPTVGVDVGVKRLAVLSTGEMIENPRALQEAQRKLRGYQRKLERQRRASNPGCYDQQGRAISAKRPAKRSKNMAATERRIRRLYARVANTRADAIHKLTHRLATQYRTVVAEDLAVRGLCRGGTRGLRRSIHDAALGEIHRQLDYKTAWHGSELVLADRWFASSKTCSDCGAVKAKLPLSARSYRCDQCGLVIDRDINAARNLAALADKMVGDGSGSPPLSSKAADPHAGSVSRTDGKTPAPAHTVGRASRSPRRHKTGTVPRQRETEKR